jgi:hypothetical protein
MEKILAINITISIVDAKNLQWRIGKISRNLKGPLFFSGIVWDRLKLYSK